MKPGSKLRSILFGELPKPPTWLVLAFAIPFLIIVLGFELIVLGPIWFVVFLVGIIAFLLWNDRSSKRKRVFELDSFRSVNMEKRNGKTAKEFLCWSMDRHAAMSTFHVRVSVHGSSHEADREVWFERPNRFRIQSEIKGHSMTSVSDGMRAIEYSSDSAQGATLYPSPDSIVSARGMMMSHPMFCGSLLYRFFAGGSKIELLADSTKAPIEYGADEDGSTLIKFYGTEIYGHVEVLIDNDTGHVWRLSYDSEPLMKMMNEPEHRKRMRRAMESEIAKHPPGEQRDQLEKQLKNIDVQMDMTNLPRTVHQFSDFQIDEPIAPTVFDTAPPEGWEIRDVNQPRKPPVEIGQPAPDFTVTTPAGESLRLSDLRGQVVFVDLWATWCGPCRKGLPDTMALAQQGQKEGFRVLAISNDDPEVIADFVRDEGLTSLPVYSDTAGEAWKNYKVEAIPSTFVVDAVGNLSAYMVGLRPKKDLLAAIKAARNE